MQECVFGAVRVKDGLFLGDCFAAEDLEFSMMNKISRVVHCCPRSMPCHWEVFGITYLKLDFQ
jgi:hypothetical protein